MKNLRCLILICCSLVFSGNSDAQQIQPGDRETPGTARTQEARAEAMPSAAQKDLSLIREAAESMIRQAAEDATRLDDHRSAVRIQGAAANTLWEIDREYARKIFQRAFDCAINHYRETRDSDRVQVTRDLSISRPDFRLELIGLVSRRDAALTRQFMEKYVEEKQRELEERRGLPTGPFDSAFGKVDAAANDLLRIAALLLDTDQKAAYALAQRAFVTGIPQAASIGP
jgi:histone H3/H4